MIGSKVILADQSTTFEPLVPQGETEDGFGFFDPSTAYSADGKIGWLVYSAIHGAAAYPKQIPLGPYVETHLAKTTDHGKTWEFVQALNHSRHAPAHH